MLPRHVTGPGLFTIPHGPVRSGVVESIEYLVETPGEDIPHLNMRVFYKHRGDREAVRGMAAADGVLLAERAEGIASVAHALAYCHAVETDRRAASCRWPPALIRVLHAELERIASHLDVVVRLADAAGLAVATARFGWHKERVLRLVSRLCGSRFGRGVVVPGGVSGPPRPGPAEILAEVGQLDRQIARRLGALMATSSFLDRLRGTGPLRPERAREHGALGPIGRASGFADDTRQARPYDAYPAAGRATARRHADGDALARLRGADGRDRPVVPPAPPGRRRAGRRPEAGPLRTPASPRTGRAVGWAEAPQGEVLYDVTLADGRIAGAGPVRVVPQPGADARGVRR